MNDLSLVSMDEIWEELKKRNEAVVLVDMRTLDQERETSQLSYKGGQFVCLGMLEGAKAQLLRDMLSRSGDTFGEH